MQNKSMMKKTGYAPVNGLRMYYEIGGEGRPLVYIPMGFGIAGITRFPTLTATRQLISVDLQGRGRTADIERPLSFEQQADDVAVLLEHLGITRVDLLGECIGGVVATLVALRYPRLVGRLATYGTVFGAFQDSYKPEILAGFFGLTPDSDVIRFQRENYRKVAPNPDHWPVIWSKFGGIEWNGFSHEALASLKTHTLIAVGDQDWVRPDHALETFQRIPGAELAILPDAGHFALHEEQQKLLPVIKNFLDAPAARLPFATTMVAYQPGCTR